jgi:hypothetical protein
MAEQEQENNKFMDDVVTTLQSFHIGDSPDNINGNNYNSENVFQRTRQRRINDPPASTGIISSLVINLRLLRSGGLISDPDLSVVL